MKTDWLNTKLINLPLVAQRKTLINKIKQAGLTTIHSLLDCAGSPLTWDVQTRIACAKWLTRNNFPPPNLGYAGANETLTLLDAIADRAESQPSKPKPAGPAAQSTAPAGLPFSATPIKDLPTITATIAGNCHLQGLHTIADVIMLGNHQHNVFDALMSRNFNTIQAGDLMQIIERAHKKTGATGRLWLPGSTSIAATSSAPTDGPPAADPTSSAPKQGLPFSARKKAPQATPHNPAPAADAATSTAPRSPNPKLATPIDLPPTTPFPPVHLAIPMAQIEPAKLQPRKTFDPAKLDELAASIKAHGVLEPIILRPTYRLGRNGSRHASAIISYEAYWTSAPMGIGERTGPAYWPGMIFELVAGERRFRAAKLAGLSAIPAQIHDLDDRAVRRIRLVENEQREDLTPLERANAYAEAMATEKDLTVESLAAELGKSPATLYGLLKLRDLPPQATKALESGKLPSTTCQLIARIPSAKARVQATRSILAGDEPMSFRQAKALIESTFTRELKTAPFSRERINLFPGAPACTTCPKMSGNNRKEFPDGRADICNDPNCFQRKVEASDLFAQDPAAQSGATVPGAAADAISTAPTRSTHHGLPFSARSAAPQAPPPTNHAPKAPTSPPPNPASPAADPATLTEAQTIRQLRPIFARLLTLKVKPFRIMAILAEVRRAMAKPKPPETIEEAVRKRGFCALHPPKNGKPASTAAKSRAPVRREGLPFSARKKPPPADSLEFGLYRALHSFEGAGRRWAVLQQEGADDQFLLRAIAREFGGGGGSSGPGMSPVAYKGGKHPALWWKSYVPKGKPTLTGAALIDKVRRVLRIAKIQ